MELKNVLLFLVLVFIQQVYSLDDSALNHQKPKRTLKHQKLIHNDRKIFKKENFFLNSENSQQDFKNLIQIPSDQQNIKIDLAENQNFLLNHPIDIKKKEDQTIVKQDQRKLRTNQKNSQIMNNALEMKTKVTNNEKDIPFIFADDLNEITLSMVQEKDAIVNGKQQENQQNALEVDNTISNNEKSVPFIFANDLDVINLNLIESNDIKLNQQEQKNQKNNQKMQNALEMKSKVTNNEKNIPFVFADDLNEITLSLVEEKDAVVNEKIQENQKNALEMDSTISNNEKQIPLIFADSYYYNQIEEEKITDVKDENIDQQ